MDWECEDSRERSCEPCAWNGFRRVSSSKRACGFSYHGEGTRRGSVGADFSIYYVLGGYVGTQRTLGTLDVRLLAVSCA